MTAMPRADDLPRPASRWGLRGDIPWRLLAATAEACPWYLEHVFNAFWSGLIGVAAREPVANLAHNLRALGVPRPWYHAWLAIRRFGSVSLDGMRARAGQPLEWEIVGAEHVMAAEQAAGPIVLWTAHMGSYDAAAAFFAKRLGARLHAVRRPEANDHMQSVREKDLRAAEHGQYTTLYNDGREDGLALELMRVLGSGQWVALQADRALAGLSTFQLEIDGRLWTLPKGPFFLPVAARAACLPVFITRVGPRRHRVHFHPLVHPEPGRDRQMATENLARAWVPMLAATIHANPDQWFVFERVINQSREVPADEN